MKILTLENLELSSTCLIGIGNHMVMSAIKSVASAIIYPQNCTKKLVVAYILLS